MVFQNHFAHLIAILYHKNKSIIKLSTKLEHNFKSKIKFKNI